MPCKTRRKADSERCRILINPLGRASAAARTLAIDGNIPNSYVASLKGDFARTSECISSIAGYVAGFASLSGTSESASGWLSGASGGSKWDAFTAGDGVAEASLSSARGTALSLLLEAVKEA